LEPQIRRSTGIDENDGHVSDAAVEHLIKWYCREPGVRNLRKLMGKIYRKMALNVVRAEETAAAAAAAVIDTTAAADAEVVGETVKGDADADGVGVGAAMNAEIDAYVDAKTQAAVDNVVKGATTSTTSTTSTATTTEAVAPDAAVSPSPGGIVVDVDDLVGYVGTAPFSNDRMYEHTPVGVVMGLAVSFGCK
jgi:Lon-like ATP-dependent protease